MSPGLGSGRLEEAPTGDLVAQNENEAAAKSNFLIDALLRNRALLEIS